MKILILTALLSSLTCQVATAANTGTKLQRPAGHLSMDDWRSIRGAQIQSFVNQFNLHVRQGRDLETQFLKEGKKSYLKDVRPIFQNIGDAPYAYRFQDKIVLMFKDDVSLTLAFEFGTNRAYIEDVRVMFDPTAPWKPQIDRMMLTLKGKDEKKNASLWNWMFPEAHALTGVATKATAKCIENTRCSWAVGALVGGAIMGLGTDLKEGTYAGWCWTIQKARPWENVGWCTKWKADKDDYARKASKDAMSRLPLDPKRDWNSDPAIDCPNGESFTAWLRETYNGKETGPWFLFHAKTKNLKITEGYIFEGNKVDPSKPDEATVKFVYDKETALLKSIEMKNDKYDPKDLSDTQIKTFYVTDEPPSDLKDAFAKQVQFADQAQVWVTTCNQMAKQSKKDPALAEAAAKNMMAQPVKPVEGSPTPVTVPASGETTVGK